MSAVITKEEAAQLEETIRLFESVIEVRPSDYYCMRALKETYAKLGRSQDVIRVSKRIAGLYMQMNRPGGAINEYESTLNLCSADLEVRKALTDILGRLKSCTSAEILAKEREQYMDEVIAMANDMAKLEAEDAIKEKRTLFLNVPAGIHKLCWLSIKVITSNLFGRRILLMLWRIGRRIYRLSLRQNLALIVQHAPELRERMFALEMLTVLPRDDGPELRQLLPLHTGEPEDRDDQLHGMRYQILCMNTIGPEADMYVKRFAEFGRQLRDSLATKK